ncbi:MAG TPA: ATP-dependent sacrificial sulfur transferase LarE [Anaerolineaceae bacterium]|nr:ATP-dependent sacrificial sulfur transferase LarE [Anaerolineaceae bacterium]HPN51686.1 ATP-dependent sacrificial sulfur transferase LarE [Anaerolineaceae bacterium]
MNSLASACSTIENAAFAPAMLEKWHGLIHLLQSFSSAAVAYSGGVDSAFLAYVTTLVLGQKCKAFTIQSSIETEDQIHRAVDFASTHGIMLRILAFDPLQIDEIRTNPINRCYYCKKQILTMIREEANQEGIETILEGQNRDDEGDYRPGRLAVTETGTFSPLAQNGITKSEIRLFARTLGLSIWDQPASPCLATRFPYGSHLTPEGLKRVAQAEAYLQKMGFSVVRVRCHSDLAKIEILPGSINRLLDLREEITSNFRKIGFHQIAVDLQGYRMGSLNEGMSK